MVFCMGLMAVPSQVFGAASINSTSCNYPFPTNSVYAYGIKPNHKTAAAFQADVVSMYNTWYSNAVTNGGVGSCTGCYRVYRGSDGNDTVSEGIGYGMLISAVLADKTLFDGLWIYAKQFIPDANGNYVMNWQITSSGTLEGSNGATDADEDMAMGLLIAYKQWGTATYLSQAQTMMAAIWSKEISSSYYVEPGDAWTGTYYSSYFAPAWYRCFATYDTLNGTHSWSSVVNWGYNTFYKTLLTSYPLGFKPENANSSWAANSQDHGYDAARYGWRTGQDYLWNGEAAALSNVGPMATTIIGSSGSSHNSFSYIEEKWNISTGAASGSQNSLQIGPALIACMSQTTTAAQTFVNNCYDEMVNNRFDHTVSGGTTSFTYFQDTLCMISELVATGNFPNFACGTVGPTATPGSPTATPTRTLSPTVTSTPIPANISLTKTILAPTGLYTSGSISISVNVCNSGSVTASAVTVTDLVTQGGSYLSWCGPYGSWTTMAGSAIVTIGATLSQAATNGYMTVQNLPGGYCVAATFCLADYSAANHSCITILDNAVANWGSSAVTSAQKAVTYACTTGTNTFTITPTRTSTSTATRTNTPSNTNTFTSTPTPTNTVVNTATYTSTRTNTATPTSTLTYTSTKTNTPTPTATFTPTLTWTSTNTILNTSTFTATRTFTSTSTATSSFTNTPVNTATFSSTRTATATQTNTLTSTPTVSFTNTPVNTSTPTRTYTPTNTVTRTPTATGTSTSTSTYTATSVNTSTSTSTRTNTPTNTSTWTPTSTGTATNTSVNTATSTATPLNTLTSTPTRTAPLTRSA